MAKVSCNAESVLKRLDPSLPLEQQLYKIKAKWKKLLYEGDSVEHGAPVIIFISSSAAQANKIIKYLPTMNKVSVHAQTDLSLIQHISALYLKVYWACTS